MNLIRYLMRSRRGSVLVIVLAGILSGFASSAFVALVNAALHRTDRTLLVIAFAAVALARIATNLFSQWSLIGFAQRSVLELCDQLARRIVGTPFRVLEQVGPGRIMSTLTDDVATLSAALLAIPSIVTNAAILLGCTVYLAWLSWNAALTLIGVGALGALGYRFFTRKAYGAIVQARVERDVLFRSFRSLTEGIKELKMNRARRRRFLERDVIGTSERLRRVNLTAMGQHLIADGWAQLMFFLIIGFMLFGLPLLEDITVESLTGFAFVALYAMTPIWGFIAALPTFQRGQAALARIEELGHSFAAAESGVVGAEVEPPSGAVIQLEQIVFTFEPQANGADGFVLGPVDLTVRPGELLFIIGGNGSGKSTFVKLLTGLYLPNSGRITVNGQAVTPEERENYREQFSVVFSDFHLFETLPGVAEDDLDRRAQGYLRRLDLDHKVRVEKGVLSTTALSQGQRRRLALLAAYLEDRPVYVFDEWAADQDPTYRQIFYSEFLPDLKARGKAVVVITHDDRYFHLGDRVIKLDYGRIVEVRQAAELAPAALAADAR